MSTHVEDLMDNAFRLSTQERADLAARLIESLETEDEHDADTQAAWDAEIQRRLNELDTGQVKPIPWAHAREMIHLDGAA